MKELMVNRKKPIQSQIDEYIFQNRLIKSKDLIVKVYTEKELKADISKAISSELPEAKIKIYIEEKREAPLIVFQTLNEILEELVVLNQYKDAVEGSYIVSKTDLNGVITYANDGFSKISGYSSEELIGKPHNIVRHSDMPKSVYEKMWKVLKEDKGVFRGVIMNRRKDGSTYWVDSTVRPILDIDGNVIEYIAFRQDITRQTHREEQIKEEKEFSKNIIDSQDSILLISSADNGLLDTNKKFYEYLDFESVDEFKEKFNCIGELLSPEELSCQKSRDNWLKNIYGEKDKLHKTKFIDKSGILRFFSIRIDKIKLSQNRAKRYKLSDNEEFVYLITLNDITELELALQNTREAVEAKSRFLANMSHEIRTPMNGILGFAELLQKGRLSSEQRKYIKTILNSGETLLGIINDILDFSKIETGKMTLEYIKFNPIQQFEPTLELFNAKTVEKRIDYLTFIDPKLPLWIEADSLRIKQILSNLIGNAIKFTGTGGEVDVRIESEPVEGSDSEIYLLFSVQDSGIGISKEQQAKIFTPFTQADDSTTRRFGGTGLGLSISKSFVDLMGSSLELDSEYGKGSKFYFKIKVKASKEKALDSSWLIDNKMAIFTKSRNRKSQEVKLLTEYLESFYVDVSIIEDLEELEDSRVIWLVACDLEFEDLCDSVCNRFPNTPVITLNHSIGRMNKKLFKYANLHYLHTPINALNIYDTLMNILYENEDSSSESGQSSTETISFNGSRVLIAEDNAVNQMFIELLLREYDIYPDLTSNGQEAYELSENRDYDLILMDINMPVLGGLEATSKIQNSTNNNRNTPIVALTANVMSGDRERFLDGGMIDYLTKPVIVKELERVLKKFLKSSKLIVKNLEEKSRDLDMIEIPKNDSSDISVELISKELGLPPMLIGKLIEKFIETVDSNFEDIKSAVASKDSEAIRNTAHKVKGSSANLRFNRLADLLKTVEVNGKNGLTEGYEDLLEETLKEINVVKEFAKTL